MTKSSDQTLEQRIEATILRALKSPNAPAAPLRMGSTPGWDSMGHMRVVIELEKEFGRKFPPYLLPKLVDIAAITKVLQSAS